MRKRAEHARLGIALFDLSGVAHHDDGPESDKEDPKAQIPSQIFDESAHDGSVFTKRSFERQ